MIILDRAGLVVVCLVAFLNGLALPRSRPVGKIRSNPDRNPVGLTVQSPVKHPASSLGQLRPPMCLDEKLDTEFGDHYNLVHPKSSLLGGRCKHEDFVFEDRRLGSGGYGVVRRALHLPTNQTYAVKSIIEMNPAWHKWIRAEECIQFGVDFPFIVKLHCSMLSDWFAWLVMDLVDGPTLRRKLQRGQVTNEEAVQIAAQLMTTIEYLHINRIVFGDLTSANVMVDWDSKDVRLIDFGFALRRPAAYEADAPRWEDEGRVLADFAPNYFNDWYAFGWLVYEMLVALRPAVSGPEADLESADEPLHENQSWIAPPDLLHTKCSELLPDNPIGCDFVDKFLRRGFRTGNENWQDIWGMTGESKAAIRNHAWLGSFNWTSLDLRVGEKLRLNPYNV